MRRREYRHVLDTDLQVLGPDHPSSLATRQNIFASVIAEQGRTAEARTDISTDRRGGAQGVEAVIEQRAMSTAGSLELRHCCRSQGSLAPEGNAPRP